MSETYYAVKDGEPLSFSDINAIFSAMYAPHTPTSVCKGNLTERHYERREDNFTVIDDEKGAILDGNISPTLINRLKGYGVELSSLS
jgi:hypothetical protein